MALRQDFLPAGENSAPFTAITIIDGGHVHPGKNGDYTDTFGLAVIEVTREKIEVSELKGGTRNYEFDYFITAKRRGFEAHRPIQPNTHFSADRKRAADYEEAYAETDDITVKAMRALLISNGILTREGKLDRKTTAKLGWKLRESVLPNEPEPPDEPEARDSEQ